MTTLATRRWYDAVIVGCILLVAPLDEAAAEELERIFVGVPNQLTLPPEFPPPISATQSSGEAAQDKSLEPQSDDCRGTPCLANDAGVSRPMSEPETRRPVRASPPEESRTLSELD